MRDYLLGTLNQTEADRIEELYFQNHSALRRIQEIEHGLIREYLDGRLSRADHASFESRYLHAPALRQRLAEVRQELAGKQAGARGSRGRLVLAGALACVAAIAIWMPWRLDSGLTEVTLEPGLTMGPASDQRVLVLPRGASPVRLVLELPGLAAPLRCTGRVFLVTAEGGRREVWSSSVPQTSEPSTGGQRVAFTVGAGVLAAQDYIAEALGPDGQVMESFVFSARLAPEPRARADRPL